MQQLNPPSSLESSDDLLALDWSVLGRLVRVGTIQAVAEHFATMAERTAEVRVGAGGNMTPPGTAQ